MILVLLNGTCFQSRMDDELTPRTHRLALTPSRTVADLLNITLAQADALIRTEHRLIAWVWYSFGWRMFAGSGGVYNCIS